ncbi:transposon, En/Spm-like, transposase-associated domain protein [Tanacetum coccineum]
MQNSTDLFVIFQTPKGLKILIKTLKTDHPEAILYHNTRELHIVVTICKLEKIFPPGFFDSMEHLVIHLVREAILGGPEQYRWMYLFERKLGILKRTIRNKARVEGSIVESYRVDELSKFCGLYFGPTVQTKLNREFRNFAPEISCSSGADSRLSIFKVPSRRLFRERFKVFTSAEMHKIHTYILLNCVEVYESILKFDQWIREEEPFINDEDLVNRREALFAQWFNTNVMLESNGSNAHLKCLAQYPLTNVYYCKGYLVNGFKFHTQTTDDGLVTQNSGVCVKGAFNDQHENDYYGLLDENIEVEYDSILGRCVVVVFKCTWFDPVQGDQFFQENERVICTTSANNDIQPFNLVHGDIEEVANDLDDNTNDDDVEEDELEDIASDENDDAELIYEEDESDYGRRLSGPSPSHSRVNSRQMRLVDHLTDDDGIEGTEISVEVCRLDCHWPCHYRNSYFRYIEPWPAWGAVPQDKKDQIWLRFKQLYQWDPKKDELVRKCFMKHATNRFNARPPWLNSQMGCRRNGSVGEALSQKGLGGSYGTDGSCGEKYKACMTKIHGEDVESHPHNQETWNEVTPVKRGITHGAGTSSDPIFVLTGIPSTPHAATSYPPDASSFIASPTVWMVKVLQKSFEELKEARARDKELFEEAKEENRKQYEEKLKSHALTMKEEMVKEANAKIAEMFAQYTQQLPIPPS